MVYLFFGEDRAAKERKIAEIKKKCLASGDARTLDYECLHAAKLSPAVLKKALLALPAVAQRRLVLIRAVDKLSAHNKNIILDFLRAENPHALLILDSDGADPRNRFFGEVTAAAQVMRFGRGAAKKNVFDVTRAMDRRNLTEALKILDDLIEDGNHPLQLMGGLVWFWGKSKRRVTPDRFKKGLMVLQEADLNIKRSRLRPEHAVEIAVTKLGSLMSRKTPIAG